MRASRYTRLAVGFTRLAVEDTHWQSRHTSAIPRLASKAYEQHLFSRTTSISTTYEQQLWLKTTKLATGNTQGTRKDLVEGVLDGHNRELRGEALVHIHQLLRC